MPSQRAIAAHHEAGHAVVALAFGATGLRASIKPRGNRKGWVAHRGRPARDVLLFITLAGPFAHRRFAPRSNWLTSDFNIVERIIFGKGSGGTDAAKQRYLAWIADHAEQTVDFFWLDIKVAAKALLKYEMLTGDEISAVIRAARRKNRRRCRTGDPPAFALSRPKAQPNCPSRK
jgi:hypothetical protein